MSQLKITDAQLGAELERSTAPVVVHGTDGRILGVFTPVDRAALQPRISETEIQRRIEAGGGRKLTDILRDLEKRA